MTLPSQHYTAIMTLPSPYYTVDYSIYVTLGTTIPINIWGRRYVLPVQPEQHVASYRLTKLALFEHDLANRNGHFDQSGKCHFSYP